MVQIEVNGEYVYVGKDVFFKCANEEQAERMALALMLKVLQANGVVRDDA